MRPKSLYFRRGLIPSWSKPTLIIRDERILTPVEADPVAPGDYIYLLAPPERAEALDRFFVEVLVMDENVELKNNRIALLQSIQRVLSRTAELTLIVVDKTEYRDE